MDCFKQQVTLAHLNWLLTHHKTDIKTFLTELYRFLLPKAANVRKASLLNWKFSKIFDLSTNSLQKWADSE